MIKMTVSPTSIVKVLPAVSDAVFKVDYISMAKLQPNKGKKEALRLLDEKVAKMLIDLSERLYAITDKMENALSEKDNKIVSLIEIIDSKYPSQSVHRGLFDGISAKAYQWTSLAGSRSVTSCTCHLGSGYRASDCL